MLSMKVPRLSPLVPPAIEWVVIHQNSKPFLDLFTIHLSFNLYYTPQATSQILSGTPLLQTFQYFPSALRIQF